MTVKKKRSSKADSDSSEAPAGCSFEESIQRLGSIVEQLEAGDLPLEESLALFEEGIKLARASQGQLEVAERRIEKLLALDDSGRPIVTEVDPPELS